MIGLHHLWTHHIKADADYDEVVSNIPGYLSLNANRFPAQIFWNETSWDWPDVLQHNSPGVYALRSYRVVGLVGSMMAVSAYCLENMGTSTSRKLG